jgi:hypothetical protein
VCGRRSGDISFDYARSHVHQTETVSISRKVFDAAPPLCLEQNHKRIEREAPPTIIAGGNVHVHPTMVQQRLQRASHVAIPTKSEWYVNGPVILPEVVFL